MTGRTIASADAATPRVALVDWQLAATAPGAIVDAAGSERLTWIAGGTHATTAAAMLRTTGVSLARRFDAEDYWFRTQLPTVIAPQSVLVLEGLATLAEVWLDGERVLTSDNMFVTHELPVRAEHAGKALVIVCRSLDTALAKKRPRPRWRAPMIENQQLRWHRTTLLGRTPGWSPPVAAVGPWRPVYVASRAGLVAENVALTATPNGDGGVISVAGTLRHDARDLTHAELVVEVHGTSARAPLTVAADGAFAGRLELPSVQRWWPHTHGEPVLYGVRLCVDGEAPLALGRVGFRTIERVGEFELLVNGVSIFCRGAAWTPLDVVSLATDDASLDRAFIQVRDAGMNMLRISGTMVYETDAFFDRCDARGILVWQDLMFANMDYPADDAAFVDGVTREVAQNLLRIAHRPSLAVICGSSEGEQQAAMFGATRDRWQPALFHETLAAVAATRCPQTPYWPSSAHGGAFPHTAERGTTSYYGVGAYLRPLDDARRAEVKFASECLAFANLPQTITPPSLRVHHPEWKAGTPRDLGAGWDFDDVRDHYVARLYGVDPPSLRYGDHDRYVALGQVVTGEVMAAVFGEWRRQRSTCRGGLIWFLRDLRSGAGWGIIDAAGAPKPAYWLLRRALQPLSVHLSDEGGNGVFVHIVNDRPIARTVELEVALYRAGEIVVGRATKTVEVAAHTAVELAAAALFEGFYDLTYAYRFGPPSHDLVVATLRDGERALAQDIYFPLGRPTTRALDVGLTAEGKTLADGTQLVVVRTTRYAHGVHFDLPGFTVEDDWFHLPPGSERYVRVTAPNGTALKGTVLALNSESIAKITVVS